MIRRTTITSIQQEKHYLEIQGIPANVTDDEWEGREVAIFSCLGIEIKDIEDCHRLGYANPKNTIVRFVKHNFCCQVLDKKMEFRKLDSKRLGFNSVKTLYFSKNLTTTNQLLAWKCRELKRTSMTHSTGSARGVIRIRRTSNERVPSIKNDNDQKSLYPDFIFREDS